MEIFNKIGIFGVPRSGTSWVGEIINSSPHTIYCFQPLFSYTFKDYLTSASGSSEIEMFFEEIAETEDPFITQRGKRDTGDFPTFTKSNITHVAFKEVRYINILHNLMRRCEDIRLCLVIRNPLSVINSWIHAPREFRADLGWKVEDEWRYALKKNLNRPEEFNGYEKWKEAASVFLYLKRDFRERVNILEYGKLVQDPAGETKDLFANLDLEYTEATESFLFDSSCTPNPDPYSVFRSNQSDNQWKHSLPEYIVEEIKADLRGTELEKYLSSEDMRNRKRY